MFSKYALALTVLIVVATAAAMYVSRPEQDPVFLQALEEANGDVVSAIKLMGYATCDQDGNLVYVSLNRSIRRNRRGPLRMNNGVLRQLKEFDTINTLIISNVNDMDDNGMKYIAQLKNLEMLNIRLVPITGKGLEELKSLKRLQMLFVDRSRLTDQELLNFQDVMPGCVLRFNGS